MARLIVETIWSFKTIFLLFLMSLILWKSRGAGGKSFFRHAKDLIRVHQPTCFVIVEPRIYGNRARRIARRLMFSNFHIADPVGYAGGICICWDNRCIDLEVIFSSPQVVHAVVKRANAPDFLLSAIYASPVL